jgi:hypothetical protein
MTNEYNPVAKLFQNRENAADFGSGVCGVQAKEGPHKMRTPPS